MLFERLLSVKPFLEMGCVEATPCSLRISAASVVDVGDARRGLVACLGGRRTTRRATPDRRRGVGMGAGWEGKQPHSGRLGPDGNDYLPCPHCPLQHNHGHNARTHHRQTNGRHVIETTSCVTCVVNSYT